MRTALVFLASLACLVAAQEPQRCIALPEYESRERSLDFERRFEREALFGYDTANQRYYRYEELDINGTRAYYHDIYLHLEHAHYRIDLRTKQCTRYELTEPFEPIAVPIDAHFLESRYIGSSAVPGAGVLANVWIGESEERGYRYEFAVTDKDCLPVHYSRFYSSSGGGQPRIYRSSFFDITLGISKPDYFIPPTECSSPPPPHSL
eukprot:m.306034 g.306034  ORF g.306034 m.306034 type:complete len:207 (+) comp40911_c0_seq1:38-658(+)